MTAEQARDYGIVDDILTNRDPPTSGTERSAAT
jgi:ATP-dependent protease ClpP protease subunit